MVNIQLEDYFIQVGDIWETFRAFLKKRNYSKLVVLVDENTERNCLPLLRKELSDYPLSIIKIAAGEIHKNINTCQLIWQKMMEKGVDRKSLTINLGGGVIGDMGGFCASTFKRGIDFVQVPTTLLSQVDASIGGKLGIDFNRIKNAVGVFRNPQAVWVDLAFLNTLPKREIRSGFAEIIKHSLIADAQQWEKIQQIEDLEAVNWVDFLMPSLEIKKRIVEKDPFEKGWRKALNFGHTIGHAVESAALSTQTPLLHGEAIAIGMICEAYLSQHLEALPYSEVEQIAHFLLGVYGSYSLHPSSYPELLQLMTKDKKNENTQINFSLINPIGNALINRTCENDLIVESLEFYRMLVEQHQLN